MRSKVAANSSHFSRYAWGSEWKVSLVRLYQSGPGFGCQGFRFLRFIPKTPNRRLRSRGKFAEVHHYKLAGICRVQAVRTSKRRCAFRLRWPFNCLCGSRLLVQHTWDRKLLQISLSKIPFFILRFSKMANELIFC